MAHPGGDLPGNPAIQLVQVAKGLVDPINIASAPDGSGRLFVVERIGRIRIVDQDGTLLPAPFLDISRTVKSDYLEQGLLGLAFDPNYETNGYFYVNYTDWRTNGDTFIVRFKTSADDPNAADLNSARVLLTYDQPHVNHNGGTMKFGPDGYLYIAVGDGGLAGDPYDNAQNRSVLLGKILRIDVNVPDQMAAGETGTTSAASGASGTGSGASTAGAASEGVPPAFPGAAYRIAAANAGIGQVQYSPVASQMAQNGGYHPAARPEIFAYGLRNPWQFAFDPQTNDMFIADVGQNQWEEIDFVPAGMTETLNFGWSRMEGAHCYPHGVPCSPTGVLPVAEYPHTDGCSITGIGVYRGSAASDLDGVYFAGDYCSGNIWGLALGEDGTWQFEQLLSPGLQITGSGQDGHGDLYVTTFKGSYDRTYNPFANPTGQVWRIVPADQVPEGAVTPSAGPTGTATPGAATGTPSATGTVTATVEATSTTTSEAAASATSAATASATSAATGTARSAATGTSTPAASGTGTGTPTACTGTPSATPSATSAATAAATASARAAATSGAGGSNAAIQLSARDIKFCTDEITVKAGQEVVIEFTNNDEVAHNFALYKDATAKDLIFRGDLVTGPDKSITYTFKALAQPGTYFFRCDPHATIMFGNFNVQ